MRMGEPCCQETEKPGSEQWAEQVTLDRHCQQGMQTGYAIVDDIEFSRLLDHKSAKERPYTERKGDSKTVCHWGQRKLMVAEIEFLASYYHDAETVVYAGAAPGTHILCLARLFPKIRFVLVDPRPFSSHLVTKFDAEAVSRIELRREYFTDDMALEFAEMKGVLFISDVRTSDDGQLPRGKTNWVDEQETVQYPTQDSVEKDMAQQQRWHILMKPVASSFKFRLPWGAGMTSYLQGDLRLPIWGPPTTTECRLFVAKDRYPDGAQATYDNGRYERQMFFFNTHQRIAKYKHHFMDFYRCSCFDCTSEAVVLTEYFEKVGVQSPDLFDVPTLSRRLDKECHRDHQNPRTLFDANPDPEDRKQRILKRQRRK